ncbi:hypothetical protein M430DRAFT_26458 [Amorphotheca resinae ATCC 22711]|uniref:RBR-type E3 ubiquitin transferase n=1 Tax=Amorphotheca resinae ATCC 22711 TaxID=857342 RepID=A0A2T3B5A2_AMORE|nr:hypothetical protein M430DRAFT_26458 [Amorphotheca resinae ATCC 22711]PSS21918.1 hypothetical protein M430DRAFT_26458 [Amorphotheca resinae ATCC 22711]
MGVEEPQLECTVCMETMPTSSFPKDKMTPSCLHASSICNPCLATCVEMQIQTVQLETLSCPECKALLPAETVKRFMSTERFERYLNYMDTLPIRLDHNFSACAYADCGFLQIREPVPPRTRRTRELLCKKCNRITCFICNVPLVTPHNCKERERARLRKLNADIEKLPLDERTEYVIQKTTSPCPACKTLIEKNGGCYHMKCSRCGYKFFWEMTSEMEA